MHVLHMHFTFLTLHADVTLEVALGQTCGANCTVFKGIVEVFLMDKVWTGGTGT